MKVLLFLFGFFLFTSCNPSWQKNYQFTNDEKLADEIIKKVAYELKREKGLIPCGTGGQMMDEIQMLALSFDYNKNISIEEGRQLLLTAIGEFTSAINRDERIRPYLANYPFLPKNVQIRIFLKNPDRSTQPDRLVVVSAINSVLEYEIDDPNGPLFKTIHKETYEEAHQVASK